MRSQGWFSGFCPRFSWARQASSLKDDNRLDERICTRKKPVDFNGNLTTRDDNLPEQRWRGARGARSFVCSITGQAGTTSAREVNTQQHRCSPMRIDACFVPSTTRKLDDLRILAKSEDHTVESIDPNSPAISTTNGNRDLSKPIKEVT
jgi:hypothetical protein